MADINAGAQAPQTTPPPVEHCSSGCGGNGKKLRDINIIEACKLFFMNYANFEGRATRAEFWWAYLMVFVVSLIPFVSFVWAIAVLIPSIAVGVRRLHDIEKSGWYYLLFLIPIVGFILMIVWFVKEGTKGANQYGEDPQYE